MATYYPVIHANQAVKFIGLETWRPTCDQADFYLISNCINYIDDTYKHLEVSGADETSPAVLARTAADEYGTFTLRQTPLGVYLQQVSAVSRYMHVDDYSCGVGLF